MTEHLDVLIIGAGLSGIGGGYHLQKNCPTKTYAILEARERLGGTWDLFRYPGIRSDSDMYTLGFSFRPWTNPKAIADGPSILGYLKDTAELYGVDKKIRYRQEVKGIRWSSADARWSVDVLDKATGITKTLTASFIYSCAGYYRYDAGYTPEFPGREAFEGKVIHPQHWPEDLDYSGKRIIVIGSGATAVTLVPELAKRAGHVTMLQRSPTYVVSMPDEDPIANRLRELLPAKVAYGITRWKNVLLQMAFFNYCRQFPKQAKALLFRHAKQKLGDIPVDPHFAPTYDPWDQRLCVVPNSDLFRALKKGTASVVTDHIETFTKNGIRLRSGAELEADIIVTATGLRLQFLGGAAVEVDGKKIDWASTMTYKGMMASDVPNLGVALGYTNASWTLKCDLTAEYLCRLLNYMDANGFAVCVPRRDASVKEAPLLDFSSGYVIRALDHLPRQGEKPPWKLYQNYALDTFSLRHKSVDDGVMHFTAAPKPRADARGVQADRRVGAP